MKNQTDPVNFLDNFDSSRKKQIAKQDETYQLKILKKYFSTTLEKVSFKDVWLDAGVENKLEEVKYRVGDGFFNKIFIKNYPLISLYKVYKNFPLLDPWKDMMKLIGEKGEAGLIFPIKYWSNHVLHNFHRQPSNEMKEPRIIWPGNSGIDLTLQNLDVFIKEYQPGE